MVSKYKKLGTIMIGLFTLYSSLWLRIICLADYSGGFISPISGYEGGKNIEA
jgi:hypothetical protein